MVMMLLYTPFPCWEGNNNGRIVSHRLVPLAMKLVVAQFCRAKEIINEGAECVQSENAMQCLHHRQLATRSQLLGWCIAGQ